MKHRLTRLFLLALGLCIPYTIKAQCQLPPYPASQIPEATSGFRHPLNVPETAPGYDFSTLTESRYCSTVYGTGQRVYHPGRDINAGACCGNDSNCCDREKGTTVYAVATGRVVYVDGGSWGGVVIQHNYQGTIWYSQYGHVQGIQVVCGQTVSKGLPIAEIGDVGVGGGGCTEGCAHLHFEIRKANHPNPTKGSYFCESCGPIPCLQNINNVLNWYENPIPFINSHGSYGEEQGTCANPINLTSGQSFNGNTIGGLSNFSSYNCIPFWNESGPERVHRVTLNSPGRISAQLSNLFVDLDVIILSSCNPNACLAEGDILATADVSAGTYYIVVDGYIGASGSYTLTVNVNGSGGGGGSSTQVFNGIVTQGSTWGLSFSVPPSQSIMRATLSWSGGDDLDLHLRTPNSISYGYGENSPPYYSGYATNPEVMEFFNPQNGGWQVWVYGWSVIGSRSFTVTVQYQ